MTQDSAFYSSLTALPDQSGNSWRRTSPQQVMAWLPVTLFFPVGIMYAGMLLFYIALIVAGGWRENWLRLQQHPLLRPVLLLSAVSLTIAVFQPRPAEIENEFWPGLGHYQTYLFLLPFLMLPAGAWQRRAVRLFFGAAVVAATLFVLNFFHLLPDNRLFHSYAVYLGNKSILLGILLAIAAAWMLHELFLYKEHRWLRILIWLYVVAVLIFLSKTRTASLMFACLVLLMICRNFRWSWRGVLLIGLLATGLAAGCKLAAGLPRPASCVINQVQAPPWELAQIRMLCTIQQVKDFSEGRKSTDDDGMRAEIYRITAGLIMEKPWTGHGIASWVPNYRQRAQGLSSASMTTPHNDYLLYATELGMPGVLALLWIWIRQLLIARGMRHHPDPHVRGKAMLLAMLTVAMMVGAMFNAILRDAVFGLAFMILLALPLAGIRAEKN
ncbi:O-antigen ligase family protein [Undibacterium griseum]|uniref:O-antigen ligase family protein n=1 Tax=Undibacterium griseum TaxID=2762295 RepID=A0ABR6YL16_9BURK|nr:O-antigen ligase family protein [Undibacterium griseum]MBC3884591.1 O-antigen ligase family protein [Undibacterium griseum]